METTARYAAIDEIVQLTQRIDTLATEDDWLSMNVLVEQRMRYLNRVFKVADGSNSVPLKPSEREKLIQIAASNQRILENAKARREHIADNAVTRRTGDTAKRTYAKFSCQ